MVDGQPGKGDGPRPHNKKNFNDGWDRAYGPPKGEEVNQPQFKDGTAPLRVTKPESQYMVNLTSVEAFTQIDVNFEIPYLGFKGVSMSDDVLMKITGLVSDKIDDQISVPKFQGFISSIIGPGFIEYRFTGSRFPVEDFSKVVKNVLKFFNNDLPSIAEILEQ